MTKAKKKSSSKKKGGGKGSKSKKSSAKKSKKREQRSDKKKIIKVKKDVRKLSVEEAKNIMRICGQEINGSLPIFRAITGVAGVGTDYAHAVSIVIKHEKNIDPWAKQLCELKENEVEDIEDIIMNPLKHGIPSWMVNRRRAIENNKDGHFVSNDLRFNIRSDIERERSTRTWRGHRHSYGKRKVRGQRTRSKGRRGGVVGVVKKKIVKTGKK